MNTRHSHTPTTTDWLARLAHDLRSPLTPMRIAASMLQTSDMPVQRVHELAGTIDRQISLLMQLADELNDVLNISRGVFHLQLAQYDLGTIIENAVVHASRQAWNRDNEIRPLPIRAPAAPVIVNADEVRLTQLFVQLMGDLWPSASNDSECWIEYEPNGDRAIVRLHNSARRSRRSASVEYLVTGMAPADADTLSMLPIIGREIANAHGAMILTEEDADGRVGDLVLSLPLPNA